MFDENIPLAIYFNDLMVGFIMYYLDQNDNRYWLTRLLIDKKYQKRGYGKDAMKLFLQKIRIKHGLTSLYTSFEPKNHIAHRMYLELGFKETGEIVDDETVLKYNLKKI